MSQFIERRAEVRALSERVERVKMVYRRQDQVRSGNLRLYENEADLLLDLLDWYTELLTGGGQRKSGG